jgi:hypothetical protein
MDEPLPQELMNGNDGPRWGWLLNIVVIAAAGCGFYLWLRPRPAFQIEILNEVPQITQGHVRAVFMAELSAMLPQMGITQGTISGHKMEQRIVLKFSREFSPAAQQQVRNVWYAS